MIARCRSSADVAAAVSHAVANRLEVAVRGGGHSVSGMSTVDGGLVIDLSQLDGVVVDPVAQRARVGGGALPGASAYIGFPCPRNAAGVSDGRGEEPMPPS